MPREGFIQFTRVYAYFRWADDLVDIPDRSALAGFLTQQRRIIAGNAPPTTSAERCLRSALDRAGWARLTPIAEQMWAAIEYDAGRAPTPIPDGELQLQIERVGDAYLGALWACSGAIGTAPPPLRLLSRAATATHHLRDLREDLALGYCNVPISASPGGCSDAELRPWVLSRCATLERWFTDGHAALRLAAPPWRTRVVLEALGRRYARTLSQVRDQWS